MRAGENQVQMVQRHVREGEALIESQKKTIQRLERVRSPLIVEVQTLLNTLVLTQSEHQKHLERIEAEQRLGRRGSDGELLPIHL